MHNKVSMSLFDKLIYKIRNRNRNIASREYYYCPFCGKVTKFIDAGVPPRPNAACSVCCSLERHRFLFYVYQEFLNRKNAPGPLNPLNILHTAPEKCFCEIFSKRNDINYMPIDLEPDNWDFVKCKKEDVTNLTFADNSFDIVLSNHVMEHIEDENRFLSELLRVLKPNGVIYLTFPLDFTRAETFEDKNINTPEDRLKYYGQADHVRIYGRDILDKLKHNYGAEIKFAEDVEIKHLKKLKIPKREFVVIIRK